MLRFTILAVALLNLTPLIPTRLSCSQDGAEAKRFDAIAKRYHQVVARRPRKGTAFDLLYRHYLDAGRLSDLVKHYEGLAKADGKNPAVQMVLGLIYERRGRLQDATKRIQQAVELAPKDYYPKYAAALLLVRQYQRAKAITLLEKAIQDKPERVMLMDMYKRLGRLHLSQGNQAKALKSWSKLVEIFPSNARVLQELAELLTLEEQFDEAIKRYQQLVKQSAGDLYRSMTARIEIGQIQVRQGKLQTAIASFESCLSEVKPTGWIADDLRRRIENVFLRGEDLAGLVKYYQQRLKKHPRDLAAMTRLATTLGKLGRAKEAIEQYRAALKVAPTRFKIRENLIAELVRQNQLKEAVVEAEALVKQRPGDTDSIRRLGQLILQHGKPSPAAAETKALATWRQIADSRANDPLAAVQVAEMCRKAAGIPSRFGSGKNIGVAKEQANSTMGKAALEFYREAVKRSKGAPQHHEYLGEFLYSIDRVEDALKAWRQIATAPRDTADNLKRLTQVLAGAEQLSEAVTTLNKALGKDGKRYDLHQLASELNVRQEKYAVAEKHLDAMERLADTPELLENTLRQRVQAYASARRLSVEARKLTIKLEETAGSVRDYWLAAMMASAERRSAAALTHLQAALKKNPRHSMLLRFKAEVHQQGGDLTGAVKQFRDLARLEPKNRTAHLQRVSQLLMELGRVAEAREAAEEIVRLTPGNPESIQRLAEIHLRSGQDEKGLKVLRQAVRAAPRDADVRRVLAKRLIERQQITEGIEHLWRAFELTPELEGKLTLIGQLAEQYIISDRLPALVRRLEGVRRKQQDPFASSLFLVTVHIHAEDFVKARRELNSLLSRRPNDARVLGELVSLSEKLGDSQQAAKYQERVVALLNNTESKEELALLYADLGKDKEAEAIWQELRVQTKDPKSLLASMDRALKSKNYRLVVSIGSAQWKARPTDWRFGYRLSMGLYLGLQKDAAAKVAQAVLDLVPSKAFKPIARKQPKNRSGRFPANYPQLFYRLQAPMELRRFLANPDPRALGGMMSMFPKELLDAQQVCAMVMYEAQRTKNKTKPYMDGLQKLAKKNDLMATRQLIWVFLSERNIKDALPLLEQWIKASPADPEPRFAKFVGPFLSGPAPTKTDVDKQLAVMKTEFLWFDKHHPSLATFLAGPYSQLLFRYGKKKEAVEYVRRGVTKARHVSDLSQIGFLVTQLQDLSLMSDLITKMHEIRGRSKSTAMVLPVEEMMEAYARLAAKQKKYDALLKNFEAFITKTNPKVIRPGRHLARATAVRTMGPGRRPATTAPSFPAATAWLDEGRLNLLRAIHRTMRGGGKSDELTKLVKKLASESMGVNGQCWRVCNIAVTWLNGERKDAIKQLEQFAKTVPGNIELRIMLARAYGQSGDQKKALASLQSTYIPFGRLAKSLEQLRLKLATSLNDEATGKKAALRLFGMRLSSSEQAALARVMRGYGLAARSEQLIKRAVRTASNKPSELVQLMRQNLTANPKRAVEIARMIIRRVSPGNQNTNTTNARYRRDALRVLKQHGELKKMIAKAEKQLAAAPKSIKLMQALVELYSANGEEQKVIKVTKRMAKARPKDGRLHYQIAQSYFKRGKFAEGITHMAIVWKHSAALALQNGYQVGRYYAQANQLDTLAKHLAALKGNPILIRYSYQITNILSNLSNNSRQEGMIKLYRVAIDIMPDERRLDVVNQFGSWLVRSKKKQLAYDLFRQHLLPQKKVEPILNPQGPRSYAKTRIITVLADLAIQLKKDAQLVEDIGVAVDKSPAFAAAGQLLESMLKRRKDQEDQITEIGNLFVTDPKFATALGQYHSTLKQELERCKTETALRVAIKVWRTKLAVQGVTRSSGASDEIRVAAIYIKLSERENARTTLVKASDPADPGVGMPARFRRDNDFRHRSSVARAMAQHGFHLDAVGLYQIALSDLKDVPANQSIMRYEVPRAFQALTRSISVLLSSQKEQTFRELLAALKDSPEKVSRYFVIADPAPVGPNTRRPLGYRSGRRTAAKSRDLSDAKNQLLTALVLHANATRKMPALSAAIAQFETKIKKSKTKTDHLVELQCLNTLVALATAKMPNAVAATQGWLSRAKAKKQIAAEDPMWLVALMALEHQKTRRLGLDMAFAVAKSSEVAGKTGRRKAAIAAVAARTDKYAKKLLTDLLKGGKGDPQILMQIAQVHYQRKQYQMAVAALSKVWIAAPETMMTQLEFYSAYYVKAHKLDALAKSIRDIQDKNIGRRYSYNVANVIRRLPTTQLQAPFVAELYFAGVNLNPSNAAYMASQFSSYLRKLPKNRATFDVYCLVLFPTKTRDGRFAEFATQTIQMARTSGQLAALKKKTRAAMKLHKRWHPRGELLLAIMAMEAKNEKPMSEFAKKYKSNSGYAVALKDSSYLLRGQLARSNDPVVVQLAIDQWRPAAANESGQSTQATTEVARLLIKLKKKDEARKVLVAALSRPFVINYQTSPSYILQMKFQRQYQLAEATSRFGFYRAALRGYAKACSIDLNKMVNNRSYMNSQMKRAHQAGSKAIKSIITKQSKQTLTVLIDILTKWKGKQPPAGLATFFVAFDPSPSSGSRASQRGPGDHTHDHVGGSGNLITTLLPALLRKAKSDGKLGEVRTALTKAKARVKDLRLVALSSLVSLTEGKADTLKANLNQLVSMVDAKNASDAVWVVAREAAKNKAVVAQAQKLLQAVAAAAGKSKSSRQQAAVSLLLKISAKSGASTESIRMLKELIVGKDNTPESQIRFARALFNNRNTKAAVDTLKPIWKSNPGLLMRQIDELSRSYVNQGAGKDLIAAIDQVSDPKVVNQYGYQLINTANSVGSKKRDEKKAIMLYEAALVFAFKGQQGPYAASTYANFLTRISRNKRAYAVLKMGVLPPSGGTGRFNGISNQLVALAIKLKRVEQLQSDAKNALKAKPDWQVGHDLLLSMLERASSKKETLFIQLAKKYRTDQAYALKLNSSRQTLRDEASKCKSKDVLELASQLWKKEIDRAIAQNSSNLASYQESHASVLLKLGKRNEAKAELLAAINAPMPNSSPNYIKRMRFTRRQSVATKLTQAGFHLSAIRLWSDNLSPDNAVMVRQYRMQSSVQQQRTKMRASILSILKSTKELDRVVDELQATLKKPSLGLDRFFVVVGRPWSNAEHAKMPSSSSRTSQLLTVALQYAKSKKRLAAIIELAVDGRVNGDKKELLAATLSLAEQTQTGKSSTKQMVQLSRSKHAGVRSLSILALVHSDTKQAMDAIEAAAKSRIDKQIAIFALAGRKSKLANQLLAKLYGSTNDVQRLQITETLDPSQPLTAKILGTEVRAKEDFNQSLKLKWNILRPEPQHTSLTKKPGTLTINATTGSFSGKNNTFANAYLIKNPAAEKDFRITTCLVDFKPTVAYQQAALLCWADADNYLKFSFEASKTGTKLVALTEQDGRRTAQVGVPLKSTATRLWLRLTRVGSKYSMSTSADGKVFTTHRNITWSGNPKMVGLAAVAPGPKPKPKDVSFDSFDLVEFRNSPKVNLKPRPVRAGEAPADLESQPSEK